MRSRTSRTSVLIRQGERGIPKPGKHSVDRSGIAGGQNPPTPGDTVYGQDSFRQAGRRSRLVSNQTRKARKGDFRDS